MKNNELLSNRDLALIFFLTIVVEYIEEGIRQRLRKILGVHCSLQGQRLVSWISIFREDSDKSKVIQKTL